MKNATKAVSLLVVFVLTGCIIPIPHPSTRFQGVSGHVIDGRTKSPIPGVLVSVEDHPSTCTTTDVNGAYCIDPEYNFHVLYVWLIMGDSWPRRVFWYPIIKFKHPGYHSLYYNAEYNADNAEKLGPKTKRRKGNLTNTDVFLVPK